MTPYSEAGPTVFPFGAPDPWLQRIIVHHLSGKERRSFAAAGSACLRVVVQHAHSTKLTLDETAKCGKRIMQEAARCRNLHLHVRNTLRGLTLLDPSAYPSVKQLTIENVDWTEDIAEEAARVIVRLQGMHTLCLHAWRGMTQLLAAPHLKAAAELQRQAESTAAARRHCWYRAHPPLSPSTESERSGGTGTTCTFFG